MPEPARLHPDDLALLAKLLAEQLAPRLGSGSTSETSEAEFVDAAEIARRFDMARSWVYDHADELGAVRLGDGARPRLRFDPEAVLAVLSSRRIVEAHAFEPPEVAISPGRRRRRTATAGAPLLPIRRGAS